MQCGIWLCNLIFSDFLHNQDDYWGENGVCDITARGQQNGQRDGIALHVPDIIMALDERLAAQERSEETGSEVLEVESARGGGSHVLQNVRCGKKTCRCAKPGGELHGPYWYLYAKKDGRTRSKYIGKSKP
jgi:hypothetical protein